MLSWRQKSGTLPLVGTLLLVTAAAQVPTSPSCTKTFGDGYVAGTISHRCEEACTAWQNASYSQKPTGTLAYDQNSPVCLSALHAGVLAAGQTKTVSYTASSDARDFEGTIRNRAWDFEGTIRNRVVTSSKERWQGEMTFSFVAERYSKIPDDKTGVHITMVHNNVHPNWLSKTEPLYVACLPSKQGQLLPHQFFKRWNFTPVVGTEDNEAFITAEANALTLAIPAIQNSRVLRCLSDNAQLDVTGIFGRRDDDYVPQYSTYSKSSGDDFAWAPPVPRLVTVKRLPPASHPFARNFENLTENNAGIYSFNALGSRHSTYARLIVRRCPRDRYGPDCNGWCPDCRNAGECHPSSGRCVCAPGTYGDRCQHYCPADHYGADCHLTCTEEHLRWSTKTSCSGLSFCTHDPKGCSCAPGFQPPDCDQECERGRYGPDCSLFCRYCRGNACNPRNGSCYLGGCLVRALCDDDNMPRNLPRFRAAPNVTVTNTHAVFISLRPWSSDSDEGILEPRNSITGYRLQLKMLDENETEWISLPVSLGTSEVTFEFIPGHNYTVQALVDTSSGSASAFFNLRIPQTQVEFPCLKESTYGKVHIFPVEVTQTKITVAGVNAEHCNGPKYEFTVKEYSTGAGVKSEHTEAARPSIDGLSSNTTYVVSVNSVAITVTTLPDPPKVFNLNYQAEAINASLTWSSERAENFSVTWRKLKSEGCRNSEDLKYNSTQETKPSAFLSSLEGFTRYEVCVEAFNVAGRSPLECEELVTKPNKAPTLQLEELLCLSNRAAEQCIVGVAGDCSDFHGPNVTLEWKLSGAPSCNASAAREFRESQRVVNLRVEPVIFRSLTPFVSYNVSVTVVNAYGHGSTLQSTHTSRKEPTPAPVEVLQWTATPSSVTLYWRPPCPPRAPISSYRLRGLPGGPENVEKSTCPDAEDFFCYSVENLPANEKYSIRVASCATSSLCSQELPVDVITKLTVPISPKFSAEVQERSLIITFNLLPTSSFLISCNVETYHGTTMVHNSTIESPGDSHSVEISDLLPSSAYQVSSYCRNSAGLSSRTNQTHSTLLLPPKVLQSPSIELTASSNATLTLPFLDTGDSSVSFTIMVHDMSLGTDPVNFTLEFLSWQRGSTAHRHRRSSRACPTNERVYVAGQLSQGEPEFVIGSGKAAADMSNCPLVEGNSYSFAVVVVSALADQHRTDVLQSQPITARQVGGLCAGSAVAVSFLVIVSLLVLAALVCVVVKFSKNAKTVEKCQSPSQTPATLTSPL